MQSKKAHTRAHGAVAAAAIKSRTPHPTAPYISRRERERTVSDHSSSVRPVVHEYRCTACVLYPGDEEDINDGRKDGRITFQLHKARPARSKTRNLAALQGKKRHLNFYYTTPEHRAVERVLNSRDVVEQTQFSRLLR